MDISYGIIGAGRVGSSLLMALRSVGKEVCGLVNTESTRQRAAELRVHGYASAIELVKDAQVIFITVPDRLISEVADKLANVARQERLALSNKYFYHCSGSMSLDCLQALAAAGAHVGSLHPLQSFAARRDNLAGIGMAVDGDPEAQLLATNLAQAFGATPFAVPCEERTLYHAAACFCSNYVVTVVSLAQNLLAKWTASDAEALQILMPLFNGTAANLQQAEVARTALTGPIARGDLPTIAAHLAALPRSLIPVYTELAKQTVVLAHSNGTISAVTAKAIQDLLSEKDNITNVTQASNN